jgi:tetratricopeptide (TPR) repeat protein
LATPAGFKPNRPCTPALASIVLAAAWGQARHGGFLTRLESRLDFTAWDYGKGLAASLPRDALVLDPDDPTAFTLSYLSAAHSIRTDIVPLLYFRTLWGYAQIRRRHPELLPPGRIDSGQVLVATLVAHAFDVRRPLYVDLPQKALEGTEPLPAGLAYRLMKGSAGLDDRLSCFHSSSNMQRLLFRRPPPRHADFFSAHTAAYWSASLNNLGIQAQALQWPEEAVALYRRALSLTPDLAEAWNNLANVLLAVRDANGAEGCYRLSLLIKPAPQVVYNLGRVYLLAGKFDLAESTFQRAISAGGPPDARNDLGLLYLRTGRVQEAVDGWRSLLGDHPGYGLAYYNLALAYEKLGRKAEAAEALETYIRFFSRDPVERAETERWLARLKKS